MSLFTTLGTGASGLGVSSAGLGVIGDNIANVGTTGYKASRAEFADIFPQYIGTGSGVDALGNGAMVEGVHTQFEQGALQQTGSVLDLAIQGGGFFQVSDGQDAFYTRAGGFRLDKDGYVVNSAGLRLQGFQSLGGQRMSRTADLQIDQRPIPQQATETISLDATLSANADFSTTPYAGLVADGTAGAATLQEMSGAADASTSVTVYDSRGVAHDVTLFFERTSSSEWSWSAVVDGGEADFDGDGVADGEPGHGLEIAEGTASFDGDGELASFTQSATNTGWTWPGSDPWSFDLQAGLDAAGDGVDGGLRMAGDTSTVRSIQQDGYGTGDLIDLRIDAEGTITGVYDNGQEQALGQVALASFDAESGLQRMGGNLFKATPESGDPALGAPAGSGRGEIRSRWLEGSTVDIEKEFVSMIEAQRSYQANASTVRVADETLQELVNLV